MVATIRLPDDASGRFDAWWIALHDASMIRTWPSLTVRCPALNNLLQVVRSCDADLLLKARCSLPMKSSESPSAMISALNRLFCFAFCAVLAIVAASEPVQSAESPVVATVSQKVFSPFLNQYCVRCHGEDEQNGQVRFDKPVWGITNNDSAQRWQDVLDILNAGDMPPEDEPQPSTAELAKVLDSLTGTLITARRRLTDTGGEIAMRRLNRREYANTIRDLFGFEIPADMIPADNEAETFDTVGSDQFFSSSHFDKYLELGREIVARGLELSAQPRLEVSTNRREPEENVTPRLRIKLADLDNKMRMKNEGKTWQEMGFKDEGEMKIVFSQFKNRAGKPRAYLQYPLVESGIYLSGVNNETKRFGINRGGRSADPRGSYRVRVRAGVNGDPPGIRKFLCISDADGPFGVVKVRGTTSEPQTIEVTWRGRIGQRSLNFFFEENRANIRVLDGYVNKVDRGGDLASIWIDWLEIEGPFYDEERAFFEKLVHPDAPQLRKPRPVFKDENAQALIEQFALEAFRRNPPSAEYVDQLLALFTKNRAAGQKFEDAMSETLAIVLASPKFLFLQEAGDASGGKRLLDDRELAIRLSYFLWSSPPDDELYACADDGSLSKPNILRKQVERMLDHPKASSFFDGFMSQWAELDRFNAITVDESDFFRFNKGVRHSAYQEVLAFFETLVAGNLPAGNLIDSDFVVINSVLGEHYGIEGAESDEFTKVSLPTDSPRGGLLGQTAFLTLGSNGERSSPVIRGALVMEKLLHDRPAPPPPNVPELGAATDKPATNRQMVELHQRRAVCASCHKKMDVIGFGLENFDTIGKWRDTEAVGRQKVPIEPGGTLPGGAAFNDVNGLKTVLLEENDRLAEELVESMLAYGLGRTIEFSDADSVSEILENLRSDDYRVRSIVHEVAASHLFRTK